MSQEAAQALEIVGDEVSVTLAEARTLLEEFAEGAAMPGALGRCAGLLHNARGALLLAETWGAGLLAEEMEETCRYLEGLRGRDAAREEGLEALSRAMVQLPTYVEQLMNGGRDIPLVLLPLLNDLRAARGRPLLSESTLLLMNLGVGAEQPSPPVQAPSGENIEELSRQARPAFQLALLGWIRGDDPAGSLERMGRVTQRLMAAAQRNEVRQLWWVLGGVLEAVQDDGLPSSVSLKRLMGQSDREIRRLATSGENACAEAPPTDLVNNLLYYAARATTDGPLVSEIRAAFNLTGVLPGDAQVEQARESLAAPSARLMHTVAEAIREDLSRVKDVLDIYVRTGMQHPEELVPQVELLRKISDTLGVLGLGELREDVREESQRLDAVMREPDRAEAAVVQLAAALLNVENQLEDQLVRVVGPVQEDEVIQEEADPEFEKVAEAVLRECLVNMARAKEVVAETLEGPGAAGATLDGVPGLLQGITAGLLMLEKERAVAVVERVGAQVMSLLQPGYGPGSSHDTERLADAMVSLEYYLETILAGRRDPWYMLDNAERCLALLEQREVEPAAPALPAETVADVIPVAEAAVPVLAATGDQPDPELLELFIEETREQIAVLRERFPVWQVDTANDNALEEIRRAYHTLKGSGRMVGAQRLGEFCLSIEALLKRVVNGTLEPTPDVLELVECANSGVAELLEELEAGTPPQQDVDALAERARAMATGQVVAPPVEPPPQLDPVLLEILGRETDGYLASLRDFLDGWPAGVSSPRLSDEIYRACHTLHGSFRMAEVVPARELLAALDRLSNLVRERDESFPAEVREAVASTVEYLDGLLAWLRGQAQRPADPQEIDSVFLEAADRLAEAEEPPVAEAVSGDDILAQQEDEEIVLPETEEPVEELAEELDLTLDFDPEIAVVFCEEAAEILEAADQALAELVSGATLDMLNELRRHLHTLKGGARMAGLAGMGDLAHDLETLVVKRGETPGIAPLLQEALDTLHQMRETVQAGQVPTPDLDLLERIRDAAEGDIVLPTPEPPVEAEPEPTSEPVAPVEPLEEIEPELPEEISLDEELPPEIPEVPLPPAEEVPVQIPAAERLGELARELTAGPAQLAGQAARLPGMPASGAGADRRGPARVDAGLLEDLLAYAGEISICQSRLNQQMSLIQFNLEELGQTVTRLRDQLRSLEMETEAQILHRHQSELARDAEFDPLELDRYSAIQQFSRALAETTSDVNSLKDLLRNLASDTETLLAQHARTSADLQDGLMRTRMVPISHHVSRLERLVRQTASETGKQAELAVEGDSNELDRQVLEKMLPPLEHMVRNAVFHGIETTAEREAAGKSSVGRVTVRIDREGSEILIRVSDDGQGIDIKAIRTEAENQELVDASATITDEEAMQLILRTGFSTAGELTQSAGRGVGMDVVASEIAGLGGTLHIESKLGEGTAFTVRLPYTLSVTQALVVRVGPETYALPLPTVEGIVRIDRQEFDELSSQADAEVRYGGRVYRFRHLGRYLGLGSARISEDQDRVSLILVNAGESSTALVADALVDSREIVVKPLGPQLAGIRGIAGATILGDGSVAVILDVGALVRSLQPIVTDEEIVLKQTPSEPLALVVDDSITMRRVTERLLDRNGFRVLTAKDGVEAVSVLKDHTPEVILLDIEMPRMDGYEFASHVRNNPDSAEVPIIMITSRTGEKHRARAIELGVNDYLGKPYQEKDLLAALESVLGADIGPDSGDLPT